MVLDVLLKEKGHYTRKLCKDVAHFLSFAQGEEQDIYSRLLELFELRGNILHDGDMDVEREHVDDADGMAYKLLSIMVQWARKLPSKDAVRELIRTGKYAVGIEK